MVEEENLQVDLRLEGKKLSPRLIDLYNKRTCTPVTAIMPPDDTRQFDTTGFLKALLDLLEETKHHCAGFNPFAAINTRTHLVVQDLLESDLEIDLEGGISVLMYTEPYLTVETAFMLVLRYGRFDLAKMLVTTFRDHGAGMEVISEFNNSPVPPIVVLMSSLVKHWPDDRTEENDFIVQGKTLFNMLVELNADLCPFWPEPDDVPRLYKSPFHCAMKLVSKSSAPSRWLLDASGSLPKDSKKKLEERLSVTGKTKLSSLKR